MNKKKIDLSDIKESDLDKTASFTDLMSRAERKERELNRNSKNIDDIEDMIDERKRSTKDLTIDLKKAKEKVDDSDKELSNTQTLDITRQMKFNLEETRTQNKKDKKKGISILNIVGEVNLLCIGYYIYILIFTNYQDNKKLYLINGGIIVLLVLLFGLSIITNKKYRKFFNILNILAIIGFVALNIYIFIK